MASAFLSSSQDVTAETGIREPSEGFQYTPSSHNSHLGPWPVTNMEEIQSDPKTDELKVGREGTQEPRSVLF